MYRTALQSTPRAVRATRPTTLNGRRFASTTTTTDRKGTWRGTAVRWGLAIGAVYWYNTSPIFMDELDTTQVRPLPHAFVDEDTTTVDAVIEKKRREIAASRPTTNERKTADSSTDSVPVQDLAAHTGGKTNSEQRPEYKVQPEADSPEALEEEANQQGAFNPKTGEINWDCPCLGDMAHGPCGEQFKSAFSCFVYSEEEPKGLDCVEKFQHMQDCFRKYPEIYGAELQEDEEEEGATPAMDGVAAKGAEATAADPRSDAAGSDATASASSASTQTAATSTPPVYNTNGMSQRLRDGLGSESTEPPQQTSDATTANTAKKA